MDSGVASQNLLPSRGVLAGSASACYELFMVLGVALHDLLQVEGRQLPKSIELECTTHVDDISLVIMGDTRIEVINTLVDFSSKLARTIINDLEMLIAVSKATLISNDPMLGSQAASMLGEMAGKFGSSVRSLGVDHSFSHAVQGHVFQKQVGKMLHEEGVGQEVEESQVEAQGEEGRHAAKPPVWG